MIQGLNTLGRIAPGASMAASRIAQWYLANQLRIEFWSTISATTLTFLNSAANAILKNADPVAIQGGSPGEWVEGKIGANATDYELIDDFRGGNITSIKTNQQNEQRLLDAITKEAETLRNRVSDIQPRKGAPTSVTPIPISTVNTRTLIMIIPESNLSYLTKPGFIAAVTKIQTTTRVGIQVLTLRGWKK